MPTRAVEEAHLLQAQRHLANAQAQIAKQANIVARLRAQGLDAAPAEAILGTMQETLRLMQAHKALIEEALAQDDRASIARGAIHARIVRPKGG